MLSRAFLRHVVRLGSSLNPAIAQCSTSSSQPASNQDQQSEDDVLYARVDLDLRSHEPAVLKNYASVVDQVCDHLGIEISYRYTAPKPLLWRQDTLKSVHKHKKHRVQYETRTWCREVHLRHVTGSTADTVLEYLQRQLPEGVGLAVTKHQILPIPQSVLPRTQGNIDKDEDSTSTTERND